MKYIKSDEERLAEVKQSIEDISACISKFDNDLTKLEELYQKLVDFQKGQLPLHGTQKVSKGIIEKSMQDNIQKSISTCENKLQKNLDECRDSIEYTAKMNRDLLGSTNPKECQNNQIMLNQYAKKVEHINLKATNTKNFFSTKIRPITSKKEPTL